MAILQEFFLLRSDLYTKRKAYMLARLNKDYEILFNKVKFIQAVIANPPQIKVNNVKRKILLKSLADFGLKPMSELNKLLTENKSLLTKTK